MQGRIARSAAGLGLAVSIAVVGGCAGCDADPPFALVVTFAGPLEVESGAEVRYQGVPIGEVEAVSLRQEAPDQPALVVLSLAIHDGDVTLREGDVFEVMSGGLMGDPFVRVTAGRESSRPLPSGATVAGRAPFLTRFLETADETLGALGELAREQRDEWLDAVREESLEGVGALPEVPEAEGAPQGGAPEEGDTPP